MQKRWLFLPTLLGLWMLLSSPLPVGAQAPIQERDRLVVSLVELAFLNDPALCTYYPCARVEGNKVTLDGYLPDSTLKDRAGQLARNVSKMTVANEIKIHPGCRLIPAVIPNELLLKNAALALKMRFPQEYKHWQMGLRTTGELVVSGSIDSHEKKLQVSQKLRSLPGCKCVVNMMQVHYANIPILAKNTVPSQGIQPVGGTQTPIPVAPPAPPTPVLKPTPFGPPAVTTPLPMPKGPKVELGPAVKPGPDHTTVKKIEPVPFPTRPSLYDAKGTSATPMPLPPSNPFPSRPAPNKVIWQSGQGSSPYQTVSSYPNANPQKPITGSYPTPYSTVKKQQPLPVLAISQAPMTPNLPKLPSNSATQIPSLAIPVNSGKVNAPGTFAIAVNRPATKPLTPSTGKVSSKLAELKKVIEMAGGGTLTNLKLGLSGNHLSIRFFVPNETQADRLADLITTLPELDGYQLKMFIDVPE